MAASTNASRTPSEQPSPGIAVPDPPEVHAGSPLVEPVAAEPSVLVDSLVSVAAVNALPQPNASEADATTTAASGHDRGIIAYSSSAPMSGIAGSRASPS